LIINKLRYPTPPKKYPRVSTNIFSNGVFGNNHTFAEVEKKLVDTRGYFFTLFGYINKEILKYIVLILNNL
jgi:hypothetical protein